MRVESPGKKIQECMYILDSSCQQEMASALKVSPKAIDKLINDKAGTCNVNDSEYDDNKDDEETSDRDELKSSTVHEVIACSDKSQAPLPHCPHGAQTTEIVSKIAQALDQEAQCVLNEEHANQSFQNTQVFTISQQLCDAHAVIEPLHAEINTVQDHLHTVKRIQDCLDMELNFERHLSGMGKKWGSHGLCHSPSSQKNHKYNPDLIRVHGKICHDKYFPEGGQDTTWITNGSSASEWDKDDHKENHNSCKSIDNHPFHPLPTGDTKL